MTVDIGIGLPQVFPDGRVDAALVARFAARAEALGFSGLWVQEGLFTEAAFLDPLELLAFAAARTATVRLGVAVIVLPRHNPVILAKRLVTLDHLSGGRLIVGLAVGDRRDAAGRAGEHATPSRARFLEGFELLEKLWAERGVDHRGRLWHVDGRPMEPKPVRPRRPPLWFGGGHPAALRRAARLADGWIGAGAAGPAAFAEQVRGLRSELERQGRDPQAFPVAKRVYIGVTDDAGRAHAGWRRYRAGVYGAGGPPDEAAVLGPADRCREALDALVAAGAGHLALTPVFDDAEQLEALAELRR